MTDADVLPKFNQIQDLPKPRIDSSPNSPWNAIPPKCINMIFEFCLARQKHDFWIASVPESCGTAEFVELTCLPNLNQKFDSDAVLLQYFCRT